MSRHNRKDITDRCKKIVDENEISTQSQFAEIYEQLYGETISQTSVHRMFSKASIRVDESTGFYSYQPKTESADDADELFDFLCHNSYGKYVHEKGVKSMWLSVDFETERRTARLIYDFCDGDVSIICGFGCLWIKCHSVDVYDRLKPVLSKYKRS